MANRIVVEVPSTAKAKGAAGREAQRAVSGLVEQALQSETYRKAESKLPGLRGAQVDVQEGTDPKALKVNVPRDTALKGLTAEEIEQLVKQLASEGARGGGVQGVERVVIDSPHGRKLGHEKQAGGEAETAEALDLEPEPDALGCYCRWRRACEF